MLCHEVIQEMVSLDGLIDRLLAKKLRPEAIASIVNSCFTSGVVVTKEDVQDRKTKISTYQQTLDRLLKIPKIEQRTPEWYEVRKGIITASEFAQALGKAKFGTQKEFFQKKSGHEEEKAFNASAPPLKWGTMFEQVACDIYAMRTSQRVHEFGLLKHPSISFFGASPDGITNNGIMVEIKCPYQRKITGEVPLQYYYQIQGQLSVCELYECDYVECAFQDYKDVDEWLGGVNRVQEIGIIVEYDKPDGSYDYEYSPIWSGRGLEDHEEDILRQEATDWVDEIVKKRPGETPVLHFWALEVYNVVRVYRNDTFLNEQFILLENIWDKIGRYKESKEVYLAEVGAPGRGRSRSAAITNKDVVVRDANGGGGYMFLDD